MVCRLDTTLARESGGKAANRDSRSFTSAARCWMYLVSITYAAWNAPGSPPATLLALSPPPPPGTAPPGTGNTDRPIQIPTANATITAAAANTRSLPVAAKRRVGTVGPARPSVDGALMSAAIRASMPCHKSRGGARSRGRSRSELIFRSSLLLMSTHLQACFATTHARGEAAPCTYLPQHPASQQLQHVNNHKSRTTPERPVLHRVSRRWPSQSR